MGLALEVATSNEWHVLKGETQYGPYTYEDMIKMMQNNLVFSFDYIWAPHLDSWTSMGDLPEFSMDRLSRLAEKNETEEVFNRRGHERVHCEIPCFVNDQQRLWDGQVQNLSEGGALIFMKNPVLLPGNVIHIHFRSRDNKEVAFNCTAEILTKRLTKQRIQHDTGIHYAVKFLTKSAVGDDRIKTLIKEFKNKDTQKKETP